MVSVKNIKQISGLCYSICNIQKAALIVSSICFFSTPILAHDHHPSSATETVSPVSTTETVSPVSTTDTVSPVSTTDTVSPVSTTDTVSPVSTTDTVSPVSTTETASPVNTGPIRDDDDRDILSPTPQRPDTGFIPGFGYGEFSEPDRGFFPGYGYSDYNPSETENHEEAVRVAISRANLICDESGGCTSTERVNEINFAYYRELSGMNTNLPLGPMEAMTRYIELVYGSEANYYNRDAEAEEEIDDIDQGVRDGTYGVIMPGQFLTAMPNLAATLNPTQLLGAANAPIITMDEIITEDGEILEGYQSVSGGLAGSVVISLDPQISTSSVEILAHELTHAGEQLIETVTHDIWTSALTGTYGLTENNDFSEIEQSAISEAGAIVTDGGHFDTLDEEGEPYYALYSEVRAWASQATANSSLEGDPDPLAQEQQLYDYSESLQQSFNMPKVEADRASTDLLNSPVIAEQMESLNNAAEILTAYGF